MNQQHLCRSYKGDRCPPARVHYGRRLSASILGTMRFLYHNVKSNNVQPSIYVVLVSRSASGNKERKMFCNI